MTPGTLRQTSAPGSLSGWPVGRRNQSAQRATFLLFCFKMFFNLKIRFIRKGHENVSSFSKDKTEQLCTRTGLVIFKKLLFSRMQPEIMAKVMAAAGVG